jgi:hypothetical protein
MLQSPVPALQEDSPRRLILKHITKWSLEVEGVSRYKVVVTSFMRRHTDRGELASWWIAQAYAKQDNRYRLR